MDKLGSYVHYRAINYMRYGTSIKNVANTGYISQKKIIMERLNKNYFQLKKEDLDKIRSLISGMIQASEYKLDNNGKIPDLETYYAFFEALFYETVESVDWRAVFELNTLYGELNRLPSPDLDAMKDINQLNSNITYLKRLVSILFSELQHGMVEAKEFIILGSQVIKQFQKMQNSLIKASSQKRGRGREKAQMQGQQIVIDNMPLFEPKLQDFWDYIKDHMGFIKEMYDIAQTMPHSYAHSEMIFDQIQHYLPSMAQDLLREELQQVKAFSKLKLNIPSNALKASQIRRKKINNIITKESIRKNEMIINLSWTDNQIVSLNFQDDVQKLMRPKPMNYTLNTTLSEVLSAADTNFINHFLNIFAGRRGRNSSKIILARTAMKEELKILSLYSLVKDQNKETNANVLVTIDPITSQPHVEELNQVILDMKESFNKLQVYMDGVNIDTSFKLLYNWYWGEFYNPNYPDAWRRINRLLADYHSRKLLIQMNT